MKIEKILEVISINKASDSFENCQYTHFSPVNKDINEIPYISSLMFILPLGSVSAGKKFKMTLEEI